MGGMTALPPPTVLLRPLLLGVVTGARSQLGLAVLAWSPPRRHDAAPLRLLRTRAGRAGSGLALAGELVADKLPRTPSRLSPSALGGRLAVGALVGALAAERRDPATTGLSIAAGVLGAASASWVGATARTALPGRTGTPDLPWALAEDAAALGLAVALRGRPEPTPRWPRRPRPRGRDRRGADLLRPRPRRR
jgi:uncharacterized membrane protein